MITALYAGILGIISLALSAVAGSIRPKLGVSVGDGGHPELLLAMRRHANFVEYVPLALILLALLEVNDVPTMAIHIMGSVLVFSRIAHAAGLKADTISGAGRLVGIVGTVLTTLVASVWAIVTYF